MSQKIFTIITLFILFLCCAALFLSGDYVVFILAYIFSFAFLFCYVVFSVSTIFEKIAQATVYALIMVSQILFDVFVIYPLLNEGTPICFLGNLLGLLLIFIPFYVKQIFFFQQNSSSPFHAFGECPALSYSEFLRDKDEIVYRIEKLTSAGQKLSKADIQEIIHDLPRHSSFTYVNNGTLTEKYFEEAADSLHDGYIYLLLTRSKSAPSELIGLFTERQYNHVSLSFDRDLHTIISYNGGEKVAPPGLNAEIIEQLTKKDGASIIVYRLQATYEQKQVMLDKIRTINNEGSAYNLLGLALKVSSKPNIMFCSQFVYTMLKLAGLNYFEKDAAHVIPSDFIELDYYRNLEFVRRIDLSKPDLAEGEMRYEKNI